MPSALRKSSSKSPSARLLLALFEASVAFSGMVPQEWIMVPPINAAMISKALDLHAVLPSEAVI